MLINSMHAYSNGSNVMTTTTITLAAAPSQPKANASGSAVDSFINLASKKLNSEGAFEWVTPDEVMDVNRALNALQENHGADTADKALDKLDEMGLLDTFVNEMYGAGAGGAVSADNQQVILSNVARIADGETLANFANSLKSSTNGFEGHNRVQEFSEAIATQSTSQSKLDYVEIMAPESIKGAQVSSITTPGMVLRLEGDTEAASIATVLGSMEGSYAKEGLNSLSKFELEAVVNSSIEMESTQSTLGISVTSKSVNTEKFFPIANLVAQNGTIEQRR